MNFSKFALCASSSWLALNIASYAAHAAESQQGANPALEEVIVTGSRIQISGYEQPTPVSVISTEQLQTATPQNLADYVAQMPVVTGSASPQSSNTGLSAHSAGLSTLNLRGLGSPRTLVLLDGQRSVGSTNQGLVDINDMPQDLVARVDVVTGGASAAYGSDALSGVVNFVLDKEYVGTKGDLSGGLTSYGDDPNWRVRLTHGSAFNEGRGHLLFSADIGVRYGIWGVPREWNKRGALIVQNPNYTATNGQPFLLNVNSAVAWQAAPGGIITSSGPLKGIYFGQDGTPARFNFSGIVANPFAQTPDHRALTVADAHTLDPYGANQRLFTRASYQFTDHINGFVQLSYSHSKAIGKDVYNFRVNNIPVKADNAFIPASVAAIIAANGITGFTMGSFNRDLGIAGNNSDRYTNRYVVGFNGDFDAFGKNWTWNAYYQKGISRTSARIEETQRQDRYALAIDAVRGPGGEIVCRSTLANPTNGCVPYNLFGEGVNTRAAIDYLSSGKGETGSTTGMPQINEHFYQNVIAFDVQGSPLSTWAGPVSVAFGAERRTEATDGRVDDNAGRWLIGNYVPIVGKYNVAEGFVETVVPLAREQVWAQTLDVNAAVRATSYSTSGFVATWKVGATWDIIPDFRIRATRSRDIRAPNLAELFNAGGAAGTTTLIDRFRNVPVNNIGAITGNLDLEPEKADTTGIGIVVQPRFLEGFTASVDYYNIDIKGEIGTIGGQTAIDYCFQGFRQFCAAITPDLSQVTTTPSQIVVKTQPFNFASRLARGFDIEASYGFGLDRFVESWTGGLAFRFMATRFLKNIQDNNIQPAYNSVGGGTIPRWRYNVTANYSNENFNLTLTARGVSKHSYDASRVECAIGTCPPSNLNFQTIDNNSLPAVWWFDSSFTYTFRFEEDSRRTIQTYLNVQNMLNKDPPLYANGPTGIAHSLPNSNAVLYDIVGRVFRAGVRFRM